VVGEVGGHNVPNAPGFIDHFTGNTISGNPTIQYNCTGSFM
jgi:hypothetical protein